jgi:hypothetical protein
MTDLKPKALAWISQQFIGVTESGSNGGAFVERLQRVVDGKAMGEPWCVCWAQFAARLVDEMFTELGLTGLPHHSLPPTESTQELWAKAKTISRSQQATPGSIVVWRSKSNPLHGHCGIVAQAMSDGIVTVEGNTSAPSRSTSRPGLSPDAEREGDGIWSKLRDHGNIPGFDLLGYVLPWA